MDIMLSFIIPVYNTGKKINRILNSLNEIKDNDVEVVIIDDGWQSVGIDIRLASSVKLIINSAK